MNYWLIKSEPETYSIDDLIRENVGRWDGVRNYTARNNLRTMQLGDMCFFYRSVHKPAVQGLCKIVKEHYPDPTTDNAAWVCVDIEYVDTLKNEVSLAAIKTNPALENMSLLKLSRLSVQPVTMDEFDEILRMSEEVKVGK
jgi:predicted RNA-binding protein with PUA-like domain